MGILYALKRQRIYFSILNDSDTSAKRNALKEPLKTLEECRIDNTFSETKSDNDMCYN